MPTYKSFDEYWPAEPQQQTAQPATPSLPAATADSNNPFAVGNMVRGNAPSFQAAQETSGAAAGKDYADALASSARLNESLFPAKQILGILNEHPETPGLGQEEMNRIKNVLITQSPYFMKQLGITPDESGTSAFEKLSKYLTANAQQNAQVFGPHTNEGLITTQQSNPSAAMLRQTISELIPYDMAMKRMRVLGTKAYMDSPESNDPSKYTQFLTKFATDIDPRALAVDTLPKDKLSKIFDGLAKNPQAGERFKKTLDMARQYQLLDINLPQQQQ